MDRRTDRQTDYFTPARKAVFISDQRALVISYTSTLGGHVTGHMTGQLPDRESS